MARTILPELSSRFDEIVEVLVNYKRLSIHDAGILSRAFRDTIEAVDLAGRELRPTIVQLSGLLLISVIDDDPQEEEATLLELIKQLRCSEGFEAKVKLEAGFSKDFLGRSSQWLLVEKGWAAFRDPIDHSAARLLFDLVKTEDPRRSAQGLIERSHNAVSALVRHLNTGLDYLGFRWLRSTEDAYDRAKWIYSSLVSGDDVIHVARTPGILDPGDYKDEYRRQLFEEMRRSQFKIMLTHLPPLYLWRQNNIGILTSNYIVVRRRQGRIAKGWSLRRNLLGRLAERLKRGVPLPRSPADLIPILGADHKCMELKRLVKGKHSSPRGLAERLVAAAIDRSLEEGEAEV